MCVCVCVFVQGKRGGRVIECVIVCDGVSECVCNSRYSVRGGKILRGLQGDREYTA